MGNKHVTPNPGQQPEGLVSITIHLNTKLNYFSSPSETLPWDLLNPRLSTKMERWAASLSLQHLDKLLKNW